MLFVTSASRMLDWLVVPRGQLVQSPQLCREGPRRGWAKSTQEQLPLFQDVVHDSTCPLLGPLHTVDVTRF